MTDPGDPNALLEPLRLAIYRHFADTGIAPSREALCVELETSPGDLAEAIAMLADARLVVLDDHGSIVMAHPFASRSFGFSVMGGRSLYWGGCAWDSFAIPHLVQHEPRVLIATTCPSCSRALAWVVDRDAPPLGDELVRFATPAARAWDDVIATCENQRIFCSQECIDRFVVERNEPAGTVFDLSTLWKLASGWYAGRLDPDYQRREPAAAAQYFRDAGVPSSFWS